MSILNTISEKYALGAVLSDSNEMDYNDVLESLDKGTIPEGVVVWEPFENYYPDRLAELLEEHHDIFQAFIEELDERRARGEA